MNKLASILIHCQVSWYLWQKKYNEQLGWIAQVVCIGAVVFASIFVLTYLSL